MNQVSQAGAPNAREVALKALLAIDRGAPAKEALDAALASSRLNRLDRALCTELVYGVTRRRLTLDYELSLLLTPPGAKLSPRIRNLLRLGLYQLRYLSRVPPYAAVSESVALARRGGGEGAARLVNAVLRRALREPPPPPPSLAVATSHPEWLVERWVRRLGEEEARALLEANNATPPLVVRVNRLRTSPPVLMEALAKEGVQARPGRWCPDSLILEDGPPVAELRAFRAGMFTVQDESSMLAVMALDPRPGQMVLDIAAAPGGKASYCAERMGDRGHVVANDVDRERARLIEATARRLGLRSLAISVADARQLPAMFGGRCDRVLADVPCSGLGVLARRPDLRWRKGPEDLQRLPAFQLELVQAAARCLRPGGALVYSTCSTEPEENEGVVEALLRSEPGLRLDDLGPYLPPSLGASGSGMLQLWPHRHGTDGFFLARIVRQGGAEV